MATRRKSTKRRTPQKRSLLLGAIPKVNQKEFFDLLKKGGLIAAGFLSGRELDKRVFKSDEKAGFQKWLEPIITGGGGIFFTTMKGDIFKYFGAGLITHSVIKAAGLALKKDLVGEGILSGLEGFNFGNLLGTVDFNRPALPPLPERAPKAYIPEPEPEESPVVETAEVF